MQSEIATKLLGERGQGVLRGALGGLLGLAHRLTGAHRYDTSRLERVRGVPLLILPSVFNPRVLRTGAFFASVIAERRLGASGEVLDLGTGSGVCAVFAARHARRVVAVDINRAAVRCARVNALLNGLDGSIDCRHGDLFASVREERFDTVFFNPPFITGTPVSERDQAWRSSDLAARFAAELPDRLRPGGAAYLLLSTFGDACAGFVDELARRGFVMTVFARRRYINERVTILEVKAPAAPGAA